MTKSHHGFLHWVMPAMLGMVALSALMSGRDLSLTFVELMSAGEPARGPVVVWAQRLVSILLVAAAAERVINHVAQQELVDPAEIARMSPEELDEKIDEIEEDASAETHRAAARVEQAATFDLFMGLAKWGSLVVAAILIAMAILFGATPQQLQSGAWALVAGAVLYVIATRSAQLRT